MREKNRSLYKTETSIEELITKKGFYQKLSILFLNLKIEGIMVQGKRIRIKKSCFKIKTR